MWSLGVCIEKMSGEIINTISGAIFLKKIIKNLKKDDWKKRFDIEDLADLLNTENINYLDFNVFEEKYLKMLVVKRKKFVLRESA